MIRKVFALIGVLVLLPYFVIYWMIRIPVVATIAFVRGAKDAWKEG